MPFKHIQDDGTEIEVYTAEERDAHATTQVQAKESEFGKTKAEIERERDEARTALSERSGEFKQFRKLNDETLAKLSVAERTIYDNGLLLEEERQKNIVAEKGRIEATVDSALRAKAGTDEKLFAKMKDMWSVIGIDAVTPEQIDHKTKMILGAISTTEPDLVATVNGFNSGSYIPPVKQKEGESFADTERGKAGAAELGLTLEIPKK